MNWNKQQFINTLRPRQNGRHFADDTFKCIFGNENVCISTKIPLKFIHKGPINYNPAFVQIMARRRPGFEPLSEPMTVQLTDTYMRHSASMSQTNCLQKCQSHAQKRFLMAIGYVINDDILVEIKSSYCVQICNMQNRIQQHFTHIQIRDEMWDPYQDSNPRFSFSRLQIQILIMQIWIDYSDTNNPANSDPDDLDKVPIFCLCVRTLPSKTATLVRPCWNNTKVVHALTWSCLGTF